MPQDPELPFKLVAAKGEHNGKFRIWYGAAESDKSPFVLTLTPRYLANALRKSPPVALEEIEEYVHKNRHRLKAMARSARARGQKALVLE